MLNKDVLKFSEKEYNTKFQRCKKVVLNWGKGVWPPCPHPDPLLTIAHKRKVVQVRKFTSKVTFSSTTVLFGMIKKINGFRLNF